MSKPEYPRVGLMTDGGQARGRPLDTVISLDLAYGRLLVLADGLGAGESPTAAEIAVDNLSRVFREQQPDFNMERAVPRFIQYAMQETNREVFKAAQLTASPTEFGASVVLTLIIDNNVYVGYCGSARMVVLRNGAATRITKDYSTLGASGDGKAAKIAKPMGFDPELSPAVFAGPIQLRTGDLFLLCSDGLYEWVEDGEMGSAAESLQAEEAVVELVNTAKQRGSSESISVVIYQTEGPVTDTADDTEGVLVAEPDQSPTEPAASLPLPPPARRSEPPLEAAASGKKLPWLVIGAAAALVVVVGLLLWAPWSSDETPAEKPVVAQSEQKAEPEDKAAGTEEEAAEPSAQDTDPVPGDKLGGLLPKNVKQLADENEPPAGGRVIEVALPIPSGKEEGAKPYVGKGKKVTDPSKLGGSSAETMEKEQQAKGAQEQPEEPAGEAEAAGSQKAGGTQVAEAKTQPNQATARVAVKPNEEEWPEENPAEAKKAEAEAKKLAAAEAKKAQKEAKMSAAEKRKADKAAKKAAAEAKKKAEAEAKKNAADAKKKAKEAAKAAKAAEKAAAEAKKQAAADDKKKAKEAQKAAAEAAKKAKEAEKAAAEAKKKADKKATAKTEEEETPVAAKSASACNSQGLKGKNATALQKTLDALKKGREAAKKSDGQIAAEQYNLALWYMKRNKEAHARCSAAVDELRGDLVNLYLRVTEYQAKKKQCKAARGRAKDAAEFGATEAQLKKALGECYAKKITGGTEAASKPVATPKKASSKPSSKPSDEDMEP